MSARILFAMALVAGFAALSVSGQSVISAHSGTIHFTEGQVLLDGQAIQSKFGEFPEVKPGQVLSTQDGRAEVLLTPGVFLRLAENSSFKMITNQLSNTRLEMQSGTSMVEVGELLQDNAITVAFHDADISLGKKGLYRFDSDPNRLRVYEGEASAVTPSSDPLVVRRAHEIVFGDKLEAKAFDPKITDEFYRWSARRDEYVAQANISAAKTARDSGYSGMGYNGVGYNGFNGMGMTPGLGSWAWNPWFGMFTYLPFDGTYYSPFGYGFYSPYAVGGLYGPYSPFLYGGTGATTGGLFGSHPIGGSRAAIGNTTSTALSRAAAFSGALGNSGSSGGTLSSGSRSGGGFASGGGISSAAASPSGGGASSGTSSGSSSGGSGGGIGHSSGGMGGHK